MRAAPGFDAIGGLLKIVPARICRDYFGVLDRRRDRVRRLVDGPQRAVLLRPVRQCGDPRACGGCSGPSDQGHRSVDHRRSARAGPRPSTPLARLVAQLDQGRVSMQGYPFDHAWHDRRLRSDQSARRRQLSRCHSVEAGCPASRRTGGGRRRHRKARSGNSRGDALQADLDRPMALYRPRRRDRQGHTARTRGEGRHHRHAGNAVGDVRPGRRATGRTSSTRRARIATTWSMATAFICALARKSRRVQIGESLRALFEKQGVRRAAARPAG